MRVFLGLAGLAALSLGGCIAERQGRYAALTTPDAAALCRGVAGGADQARCRGAFAQDAAQAAAAENVRLRYASEQVGTGLARMDEPDRRVRCVEGTVGGRLATTCTAAPRP